MEKWAVRSNAISAGLAALFLVPAALMASNFGMMSSSASRSAESAFYLFVSCVAVAFCFGTAICVYAALYWISEKARKRLKVCVEVAFWLCVLNLVVMMVYVSLTFENGWYLLWATGQAVLLTALRELVRRY
jgi:hypothetical protein